MQDSFLYEEQWGAITNDGEGMDNQEGGAERSISEVDEGPISNGITRGNEKPGGNEK